MKGLTNIVRVSSVSLLLLLVITMNFTSCNPNGNTLTSDEERIGALVNNIVYKVITQDDQQVLALIDAEIDIIGDAVDPTFFETLQEADNIAVDTYLRNGYGYVVINSAKYPLNITDFRRALAYAVDKDAISEELFDGFTEPQDSLIPKNNPYSIEGQLSYSYYDANIAFGNDFLDRAGFIINSTTGFRMAPDGSPFNVTVEIAQCSGITICVADYFADALLSMNIDAVARPTDFYEYLNRLYCHGDYDIVFISKIFNDFTVDWLAEEFWSENADEPYQNFAKFTNATFDSWRDQLLHSTDYDEVYEAAREMQKILVYECPIIIAYQNRLLTAYRTDKFEGFVNDPINGMPNWWTAYHASLMESEGGPFGGTLRFSNPLDIGTFNFMADSSVYTWNILENLYDSLLRMDQYGNLIPWLAESYTIETHADNPSVTSGHTRVSFKILSNATWSDGTPITAEDVAFTFWFYRDAPDNPFDNNLHSMTSCYSTATELIMEFNTESYWHLHSIGTKPILPKHIFSEIGVDNWSTWTPNPPVEPMVTSGAFNVSDYVAGEYIELSRNPNYFYSYIPLIESTIPPDETETTSDTDGFASFFFSLTPGGILVTSTSIIIIVGVIALWKKELPNE